MSELRAATASAQETRSLAASLASVVRPGDTVVLAGDLGAGKTTFAQGFAAGLGVTDAVTSPTFTLVRPYRCAPDATGGIRTLLHADLYRLDRLHEVLDLGLGELVEDDAVALVEWGEVAEEGLGPEALVVTLRPGPGPDDRTVELSWRGASWGARHGALAGALAPWSGVRR